MVNIVQCLDKIRIFFTIMHENKNVNLGCLQQIYVKTRAMRGAGSPALVADSRIYGAGAG